MLWRGGTISIHEGAASVVRAERSPWLLPAALLAGSLAGCAWLGARPSDLAMPVAALFPPWWSARDSAAAASAAGGAVLRFGVWPSLVVTQSSETRFAERLRASGAWLLLDPKTAGLCGTSSERLP